MHKLLPTSLVPDQQQQLWFERLYSFGNSAPVLSLCVFTSLCLLSFPLLLLQVLRLHQEVLEAICDAIRARPVGPAQHPSRQSVPEPPQVLHGVGGSIGAQNLSGSESGHLAAEPQGVCSVVHCLILGQNLW